MRSRQRFTFSSKEHALVSAVRKGKLEKVESLISAGADVNTTDDKGYGDSERRSKVTPLHLASLYGHTEIVKALISAGADVNETDSDNDSALDLASRNGHTEIVKALIAAPDTNVETMPQNGNLLLHGASRNGHTEIVKALIDAKADVKHATENGNTLLHGASRDGHTEIVKALIDAKADVNAKDTDKDTPLHGASRNGHTEIVKALINAGADVNAKDTDRDTPLHGASRNGHTEIVEALINAPKATREDTVDAKDRYAETPLHGAMRKHCKSKNNEVIMALIAHGADVNARDNDGDTPLHFASRKGLEDLAEILISKGAAINAKTPNDETPLCCAIQERHTKLGKALFAAGGIVYTDDDGGDEGNPKQNSNIAKPGIASSKQLFLRNLDSISTLLCNAEKESIFSNEEGSIVVLINGKAEQLSAMLSSPLEHLNDFLQLKLYYTAINAYYRTSAITHQERSKLIVIALNKATTFCNDGNLHSIFEIVVKYAFTEKIIDEHTYYRLRSDANTVRVFNSEGIQYMLKMIQENRKAILENRRTIYQFKGELDELREATSLAFRKLHDNIIRVNESLNTLREGVLFKQRVLTAGYLVSAILGAFTFGAAGSAVESFLGLSLSSIVDFGNAAHITEALNNVEPHVLDSPEGLSLGDTLQKCRSFSFEVMSNTKLNEAVHSDNTVIIVNAAATVFGKLNKVKEKPFHETPVGTSSSIEVPPALHVIPFDERARKEASFLPKPQGKCRTKRGSLKVSRGGFHISIDAKVRACVCVCVCVCAFPL